METAKKGDFVEIEFTGFTEGKPFDSNIAEDLKKISPEAKAELEKSIEAESNKHASLTKQKESLLSSPEAAATYLEKRKLIQGTTEAFGSLYQETTTYGKDEAWFANQNLNL